MPAQEIYGPALSAVNNGVSQTFDYGIGMTCLTLFLIASIVLNVWLLKILFKVVPALSEIKEALKHEH